MRSRTRAWVVTVGCLAFAWGSTLRAQERPSGVTDSLIEAGRALYVGAGACAACHGEQGQGTDVGEPLTHGRWQLGQGDYEWLIHIIRHSGIGARGRNDDPMPMRGPTLLSEEEVRAVAAYVWSISRERLPKP